MELIIENNSIIFNLIYPKVIQLIFEFIFIIERFNSYLIQFEIKIYFINAFKISIYYLFLILYGISISDLILFSIFIITQGFILTIFYQIDYNGDILQEKFNFVIYLNENFKNIIKFIMYTIILIKIINYMSINIIIKKHITIFTILIYDLQSIFSKKKENNLIIV